MRPKSKRIYKRSSCPVALLLFLILPLGSVWAASFGADEILVLNNDTIIIDGKRLIVERELFYDTLQTVHESTPEPDPPKLPKKRNPDAWRLNFHAAPGMLAGRLGPQEGESPNLDAFRGKATQFTGNLGLYVGLSRKLNAQGWRLETGFGLDFIRVSNSNFQSEQFSDSLFTFVASGDGQVQHIDRTRFPIGAEFDTLATALVNAPFLATWLSVPLGLSHEKSLNKSTQLRFGFGAQMRFLIASEVPDVTIVSNEAPPFRVVESGQNVKLNSFFFTPYAKAGARFKIDRNWWFSTGLQAGWVFRMIDFADTGIQYTGVHLQALIGLEYTLGK